jgi:hypothetical protein
MAEVSDSPGKGTVVRSSPSPPWLARGLLGFKACGVVAAVAKGLVFRLAAATEIEGRELVFLILFTLVVEQFGSALHLIGTVFRYTNYYISHSFLRFDKMIHPSIPLPSMTQRGIGFNYGLPVELRL